MGPVEAVAGCRLRRVAVPCFPAVAPVGGFHRPWDLSFLVVGQRRAGEQAQPQPFGWREWAARPVEVSHAWLFHASSPTGEPASAWARFGAGLSRRRVRQLEATSGLWAKSPLFNTGHHLAAARQHPGWPFRHLQADRDPRRLSAQRGDHLSPL